MKIVTLSSQSVEILPFIREIFLLSADPKNVSDDSAKNDAFFEKWTGYYVRNAPEWTYLAMDGNQLLGYVMCATDSVSALSHFRSRIASYELFIDQFQKFPSHLHIDCHPSARGKGVGSALLRELIVNLKASEIPGIHLLTSPAHRNVEFYRRNGYNCEIERDWRGHRLLFMGKEL